MTARLAVSAAVLAAAALPLAPPAAAGAPAPDVGRWQDLAGRIAAPWPGLQQEDGGFPDYMAVRRARERDRYGNAMLGYGLLQVGVRTANEQYVAAGLRALLREVRSPVRTHSVVFRKLALASAYNLAATGAADHPLFVRGRRAWENRLRRMRSTWLRRAPARLFNQHLVDAVVVLELVRSGLHSRHRGTVLSHPRLSLRRVRRLVAQRLPSLTRPTGSRFGHLTVAADGPGAYHALTVGFYGRVVRLLGKRATARSRRLFRSMARASWAMAAPDGAVAYLGRSLEQSWALPLTAYGAESAVKGMRPVWAARMRALSRRTLRRLELQHAGGAYGLYLTPGFRTNFRAAVAAQDRYVSGTAYTGLTLVALGWTVERMSRTGAGRVGRLASDRAGAAIIGRGLQAVASVTTGRVWFAVRMARGAPGDLRSDAGLVALKARDRRGVWREVLPARPRTHRGRDSTGPVLRYGGSSALPYGVGLSRHGRSVFLRAALLDGNDHPVRERTLVYRARPCGVDIRLRTRRGERWEYSTFLPARPKPRRRGRHGVAGGNQRAVLRAAGHIRTGGLYHGASVPRLTRAVLSARARRGTVVFALRARSCLKR